MMMSDADMAAWAIMAQLFQGGFPLVAAGNASSLRARCPEVVSTLWHHAGQEGRIEACEYLKSKGLLDLIERRDADGLTPLSCSLIYSQEEAARWLVQNGANINAVAYGDVSAFRCACLSMSPSFVEELAGKVAPEHLTMYDNTGWSPTKAAFIEQPDPLAIVRMLILRGVPARPEDFPASSDIDRGQPTVDLLPRRLIASFEADLDLNDRTFLGLFLAGDVHAPDNTPACTATTTTATAKRVRTQRPDGSWSDPVTVPCEPHLVVTAAPTIRRSGRVEARVGLGQNHLPKLRGYRNSEVRIEIAAFLGVREALDLKRLRAARDVLRAGGASGTRGREAGGGGGRQGGERGGGGAAGGARAGGGRGGG